MVGADTLQRPGGDAAVVRVHGTRKALAMTTDCTPRYCYADPYEGGKQAVAEAWRNLIAVGAKPLAITDCMNFGNPQRPEIMGQFVGCIEGMAEACRALDFPVVSGNVSLYNETDGTGILPTPAIGAVGLIDDYAKTMTMGFKAAGEDVWLIGAPTTSSHVGQSLWLREILGREDGPPPSVDPDQELAAGRFVAGLIEVGMVTAVHDVSDGGVLVALAEMALAGNLGLTIETSYTLGPPTALLFGEDQGRYLITTSRSFELSALAAEKGQPVELLGRVGGEALEDDLPSGTPRALHITLAALRAAHEGTFPAMMAAAT